MQSTLYDNLEIIYLFAASQFAKGVRHLQGLSINFRDGKEVELENLTADANKLKLYVLSVQQFIRHRVNIRRFADKSGDAATTGFFLVENPESPCTIRDRKKLQLYHSPFIVGDLRIPYNFDQMLFELNQAIQHLYLNANYSVFSSFLAIRDIESRAINEVGHAMTSQASIGELLRLVLEKSMQLTHADAGFILLRDDIMNAPKANENSVKLLRQSSTQYNLKVKISRSQKVHLHPDTFDAKKSPFTAFVVNRSCVVSWLVEKEFAEIRSADGVQHSVQVPPPQVELDEANYYVKSYCAVPLRTPSEEVIGFILLLNRRTGNTILLDSHSDVQEGVVEFTSHDINILESIANQAGVSVDHTRLIKDLKTVFESFVEASVIAIESRDPTTKGHSERVAILSCGLAEAVNQVPTGFYGNINFTPAQLYELKYASLLHDFGKIGVREDILKKEKKLFPQELTNIKERFLIIEQKLHLQCLQSYINRLMSLGRVPAPEDIARIEQEVRSISQELAATWSSISEANEPQILNSNNFNKILEIANTRITVGQESFELLTPREVERLSIRRGSLSPDERIEIENHVTHSYRFLIQIPWTSDLANLPEIVYGHHERLDGSGYPRKLAEDDIPIQAKIMAIADIYDALVAMDRPYKKSIPQERALSILEMEVKDGKLDKNLFQIFVEAKIPNLVSNWGENDDKPLLKVG